MDTKMDFRKNFIERRNLLSTEEVIKKSGEIFCRVYSLKAYDEASVVMAYMSFGNEVMTGSFIEKSLRDGKRVVLPKVAASLEGDRYLEIYEVKDLSKGLIQGFKGILEPDPAVLERAEPEEVDFAVIPGIAFDRQCNRMGFGAGYYDRFLPKLDPRCLKAGVAFDIQLAEQVPTEEHDFRLDMIITESAVYCRGNQISIERK